MTFDRIEDLRRALDSGQVTCVALAEESLRRAAEENPSLNALAEIFDDSARAQAAAVDARRAQGDLRPLDGVTMVIKDNMVYSGHSAGASSKILSGFVSPYTATAVQRLLDAGAIIIGRASCDEGAGRRLLASDGRHVHRAKVVVVGSIGRHAPRHYSLN